jgi:hypothetical protein
VVSRNLCFLSTPLWLLSSSMLYELTEQSQCTRLQLAGRFSHARSGQAQS